MAITNPSVIGCSLYLQNKRVFNPFPSNSDDHIFAGIGYVMRKVHSYKNAEEYPHITYKEILQSFREKGSQEEALDDKLESYGLETYRSGDGTGTVAYLMANSLKQWFETLSRHQGKQIGENKFAWQIENKDIHHLSNEIANPSGLNQDRIYGELNRSATGAFENDLFEYINQSKTFGPLPLLDTLNVSRCQEGIDLVYFCPERK